MRFFFLYILIILITSTLSALSLKEAFDEAEPDFGYDKYLELNTGEIYKGGLLIGKILCPISDELEGEEGLDVKIQGNGAIIDLQGEEICISFCNNALSIEDCIIINGNIRYRGIAAGYDIFPNGSVKYVTFYNPHDYGVRIYAAGNGISLENNIFVNAQNTGNDYIYTNGISSEFLPTGSNVTISAIYGYGIPDLIDNWSYHTDIHINADSLNHFMQLCEYG